MATALLFWQTRAGPAAQLLGATGAAAFAWIILSLVMSLKHMVLRVGGVALIVLLIIALARGWLFPGKSEPPTAYRKAIDTASGRCPSRYYLHPIATQKRGMIMSFVDLGPRLITMTHHDAITGPYHRNATQIVDVMHAWRGDSAFARRVVERYHVDYLLICPNMSESTIYRSEAPRGFYMQLLRGRVPAWLAPVQLPRNSPFRMWRVVRTPPTRTSA
jgi:hypothetical protein